MILFEISLSVLIALFDDIPIDNLPERSQMVRATVLIVQIVGMFPYIKSQQRLQTLLNGIGSIWLLRNDEFAILVCR